eukprot:jgi/Chlat1/3006/Chrsp2S08920
MSRVCVKGVPTYVNEDRLREHFSARGEVTDVRIPKTIDGRSRQMAFVGFKTEEAAAAAIGYFNKSYLDTSRLIVELAYAKGDASMHRPWSKHSEGRSAWEKTHHATSDDEDNSKSKAKSNKGDDANGKDGNDADDPQLQEFLAVMQPRRNTKLWANDTVDNDNGGKGGAIAAKKKSSKDALKAARDEAKPQKVKSKRNKGQKDGSESDDSELYEDVHNEVPKSADASAESSQQEADDLEEPKSGVVMDDAVSNMDYLRSRVATFNDETDEEEEEEDDAKDNDADPLQFDGQNGAVGKHVDAQDDDTDGDEQEAGPSSDAVDAHEHSVHLHGERVNEKPSVCTVNASAAEAEEADLMETGRLFVRNLAYTTTEEELSALFGAYGELSDVHVVRDRETKRSKGFAYVLFLLPEHAVRAKEELDGSVFQGRLLHLIPAKLPPALEARNVDPRAGADARNKFKTEREEQKKASERAGNTKSWNALFMRSDTVADSVAERYGLRKSELVDVEAGDLAVRMALAETQTIAETKKGLEEEGVDVSLLEKAAENNGNIARSNNVLIVKNLPFSTQLADLLPMFEKFGTLGRVVLPSSRALALVEYLEPSDAKPAFRALAYKRFQHVPLYLEWAPEGVFNAGNAKEAANVRAASAHAIVHKKVVESGSKDVVKKVLAAEEEDETRVLFVKNLAFATNDAKLKAHFNKGSPAGLLAATVKMKAKGKDGKKLSMGFGFVEYRTTKEAAAALAKLQGSTLDGHALDIHYSTAAGQATEEEASKARAPDGKGMSSTKLIVRNVAFEATRKDLQQLFAPFGQVKNIRLPRKFDGTHRGFAFVEFVTKREADSAFEAMRNTHLYGRHLVFERAKEEEGLDELRAKTAAQFSALEEGGATAQRAKKRRKATEFVDDAQHAFASHMAD